MKRRSVFDNNLFVRLFSITLGFLLWAVVSSYPDTQQNSITTTTQTLHGIPVIVLTSPRMMSVSVHPVRLDVSISGSVFDVAAVQTDAGGIRAIANATTLAPGIHRVPIVIENTPTSAVTYVPNVPYAVVDVEKRATVQFPLNVKLAGKPIAGLRLGQPNTATKQVEVSGPASLVQQVAAVKAVVDVSGSTGSFTRAVAVLPVNRHGEVVQGVFSNPETVTLTVPVLNPVERLALVPEVGGQPATDYAVAGIKVSPAAISVAGPPFAKTPAYLPLPFINVDHLTKTKTFTVAIPAPYAGAELSIPTAQVTMEIAPRGTLVFEMVPVKTIGAARNKPVSLIGSAYVRVKLSGAGNLLQGLQAQDISAFVDVSRMAAGKRENLPVMVSAPVGVQVVQIYPKEIPVATP